MCKRILIGIMAGLFIGITTSSTQAADKAKGIPEPQIREDIGIRKLADEIDTISVSGRLVLKPGKKQDKLLLHSQDAKTYLIKGELVEKLKNLLLDLGENNLVSLAGVRHGLYDISCRNAYSFDSEGKKTIDTQCIRCYHLKVTQISEAKVSDEKMPPAERDAEEEKKTRISVLSHLQQQDLMQMRRGEIKGKVSSLNLRSPVKTLEVNFRDKDNQLINKTFLLSSNTRIAKGSADNTEPIYLTLNSLRTGQEVAIVYLQDERKTEALFITIIND